jgi:cytochrome c peroxidase
MRPIRLLALCSCLLDLACSSAATTAPTPDAAPAPDTAAPTPDAAATDLTVSADAAADLGTDLAADLGGDAAALTAAQLEEAKKLSPLPDLPKDPTNKYADQPAAATLGQRLFFDPAYSGPIAVASDGSNGGLGMMGEAGKISCASCHMGAGLADQRSKPGTVSLGAGYLGRNALGLLNSSYYRWTNWAGRFSAQWELPIAVIENANNMNGTRLRVAHLVFDKYRADYEAIFGPLEPALGTDAVRFPATGKPKAAMAADGPWELMTPADRLVVNTIYVNVSKALEAYTRKLVSKSSRFDAFMGGATAALTAREQHGLGVFLGKGQCVSCHAGPNFTDDDFHNLGVPQTGERVPAADLGRFTDITPLLASPLNSAGDFSDDKTTGRLAGLVNPPPDSTKAQFRTPSLRNVANSGPYMHAGQFKTLAEVVDFYDRGGGDPVTGSTKDARLKPLALTADEKADLVAFLDTLTLAGVPPAVLEDTSKK